MAGSVNFNNLRPSSARGPAHLVGETFDQGIVASKAQQFRTVQGPVAILWDIENCPVPGDVNAEDVAGNIRMALRVHPAVKGAVTMFSAYGDFNHFPRRLREGFQRTGVNLIDVPNGKKDASDKAILVDMFLFALDNPPPCTILLISGDVDFAPALHKLGQRGYTVVLAIPAGVGVSSALCNAGRFVWDWPSVASGEGLVPTKAFLARAGEEILAEFSPYTRGTAWHPSDDSDLPTEDERYAYWRHTVGTSHNHMFSVPGQSMNMSVAVDLSGSTDPLQGCGWGVSGSQNFSSLGPAKTQDPVQSSEANSQSFSVGGLCQVSQTSVTSITPSSSLPNPMSSHSFILQRQSANSMNVDSASVASWVQPGDMEGLKCQLTMLLNMNKGKLLLLRIPSEYCKHFGRPLYLSEYGSPKLVHLIERMTDVFVIRGEGNKRMLHLKEGMRGPTRHRRARPNKASTDVGNSYKFDIERSGELAEDGEDFMEDIVFVQDSEACSDGEKAIDQLGTSTEDFQKDEAFRSQVLVADEAAVAQVLLAQGRLERFRQELQELLVSHACKILLASFLRLYQERYSRDLDVSSFGVVELESLLEKVQDVAVVIEEQGTRRKFLVAAYLVIGGCHF